MQLLPERVSGGRGAVYVGWELNLVLADGTRRNVLDQGRLDLLRFLGVPLWDVRKAGLDGK